MDLKKEIGIEEKVDDEILKELQKEKYNKVDESYEIADNQMIINYNKELEKQQKLCKKGMTISILAGLGTITLAVILYFVAGLAVSIVIGLLSLIAFGIAKFNYDCGQKFYDDYKQCTCGSFKVVAVADCKDIKDYKSRKQIKFWVCLDCMEKFDNPVYDPNYKK